ncbi:hypothetical protein CPC08DRAFT_738664 [Agrocybe pediades]|nr:hypothetical protein CPC08DRAFT_738664 [Agrocybe pediades]
MPPRELAKDLPNLPLSVVAHPNSNAEDSYPFPPSPNSLHPAAVIDASVASKDTIHIKGIVLTLPSSEISNAGIHKSLPTWFHLIWRRLTPLSRPLIAPANAPVALSAVFSRETTSATVDGLRWALQRGVPVDIDIHATLSGFLFESLDDLVSAACDGLDHITPIVLSNILPPPHDTNLPTDESMNHPTFHAFEAKVAALSLIPHIYVKFHPPGWEKIYLDPVLEAFGFERIIFGSSPSSFSMTPSNVADWYEIARGSLAEVGVEQDIIDAVFAGNAATVYGKTI